jgi:hypothetical protein
MQEIMIDMNDKNSAYGHGHGHGHGHVTSRHASPRLASPRLASPRLGLGHGHGHGHGHGLGHSHGPARLGEASERVHARVARPSPFTNYLWTF